jgi:hypothetical protein
MERQVQISGDRLIERMRGEFERTMRQVGDAVNQAPNGQWINGSEVQVLELMTEFRRKTFETALQMLVDQAEGAFSPGGRANAQEKAEQGTAAMLDSERQRMGIPVAATLSLPRRRNHHPQR